MKFSLMTMTRSLLYKFINECESNLGVIVGHERTFAKLILTGKKHYIGLLSDSSSEPVIKGMEGLKSDRPEFIHKVFRQLVDDIKCNRSPIPRLKKAFDDLEHRNVPSKELAISLPLRKNPEDYDLECRQSRRGRRLHLSKGMTLVYYKTHREEIAFEPATGKRRKKILLESDDPDDISYAEYKKMMLNSVKDVVRILGYDIDHLTDTGKKWVKESVYFRR